MKEKEQIQNEMRVQLPSMSVNESVARSVVAAFCAQLDPSMIELADIKCVVSEAVTNCIVHAYKDTVGIIYISVALYKSGLVRIEIRDRGVGIGDVKQAREPLFTTDAQSERSGMGFTVMESFSDKIRVYSKPGVGTRVVMYKRLSGKGEIA